MDVVVKSAGILLLSCVCGLLIKKTDPEISLLLGMAASACVLICASSAGGGIGELKGVLEKYCDMEETLLLPVVKCCAAAVITKLSSELCREASQPTAAYAIEMVGVICSLGFTLPIVSSLAGALCGMV